MKNILFPTDFSDTAENAFRFAIGVAIAFEAHIDLLHTYKVPLDYHIPADLIQKMSRDEEKTVHLMLDKVIKDYFAGYPNARKKITIEPLAVQGFTADKILESAKKRGSDLIVMGTQGASGWSQALVGSMTSSVIERAKVPVLAIPEGAKFNGFQHIVYGSDFSPSDFGTISQLHEFGELFNSKIHCIHIADDDDFFVDDVAFNLMKEKYYEEYPKAKNFVDFKVLLGDDVEDGLKDAVKAYKADLLAMTGRKQNFFERLFGHSDTKRMAYDTEIPLLAFQE